MSNFVSTYVNAPSLLLYQPKVEVSDDKQEDRSVLSSKNIKLKKFKFSSKKETTPTHRK